MKCKKKTKAQRVLNFIRCSKNGRTFGEIQRFVVEMNGLDYDQMGKIYVYNPKTGDTRESTGRIHRGYWCDYLCDTHKFKWTRDKNGFTRVTCNKKKGLLSLYCNKIGKRYHAKSK